LLEILVCIFYGGRDVVSFWIHSLFCLQIVNSVWFHRKGIQNYLLPHRIILVTPLEINKIGAREHSQPVENLREENLENFNFDYRFWSLIIHLNTWNSPKQLESKQFWIQKYWLECVVSVRWVFKNSKYIHRRESSLF
jgi:hypothetical protein